MLNRVAKRTTLDQRRVPCRLEDVAKLAKWRESIGRIRPRQRDVLSLRVTLWGGEVRLMVDDGLYICSRGIPAGRLRDEPLIAETVECAISRRIGNRLGRLLDCEA